MEYPIVRYLIDTNIWIEATANVSPAVALLEKAAHAEWAGYSAITRLEAFGYPGLSPDEELALADVMGQYREVAVTTAVIDEAIKLRKSRKIRIPDALIAATAVVMGAVLVTRNDEDFRGLADVVIENPFC